MATTVQAIAGHNIILATPEEAVLDLADAKALLAEIEVASASMKEFKIIIDTLDVESSMTVYDYWHLAVELNHYRHVFYEKTAIVCPPEQFELGGFFAHAAHFHGVPCQCFADLQDAIAWLIKP
jgi:hypothetical protein